MGLELSNAELEEVILEAQALSIEHYGEPDWTPTPATQAELDAAAEHLGFPFPEDLATLYRVAGAGEVVDRHLTLLPLTPTEEFPESLFVYRSKSHQEFFGPTNVLYESLGIYPSDKVLELTAFGQFGTLYEAGGEHAGQILYYDVLCVPLLHVEAPSLTNYLLYFRDCLRLEGGFEDPNSDELASRYGVQR